MPRFDSWKRIARRPDQVWRSIGRSIPTRRESPALSGKQIGEACGCDHTVASRIASGQRGATIDEWCALLDLMLCVSRDQHEFMRRVTARVIANEEMSQRLFEDPE
jgi:hypothetical protein